LTAGLHQLSLNVTGLLARPPSEADAVKLPAGTGREVTLHPGADVSRAQETGKTVGTPRARSVSAEPRPATQSAELQMRFLPAVMTRARNLGPMLKAHVRAEVDTTFTLNSGSWPTP
jgi:hypothetical protein